MSFRGNGIVRQVPRSNPDTSDSVKTSILSNGASSKEGGADADSVKTSILSNGASSKEGGADADSVKMSILSNGASSKEGGADADSVKTSILSSEVTGEVDEFTIVERLPVFPTDALPEWLGRWAEETARALQVPLCVPSMLGLAILATVCAKRFVVRVRPDWREGVNLFIVIVLDSANRKSAAFEAANRPIRTFEEERARAMAVEIAHARAEFEINEARMQKLLRAATKDEAEGSIASQIADLLLRNEKLKRQRAPRLIVDDVTPERLVGILAENHGRIAILSPEGGVFDIFAGKYSKDGTSSIDALLKGHQGEDIRVDRVGRAAERVSRATITIGLTVQPTVIRGLAAKPGFRGKGLIARILFALPASSIGFRKTRPTPVSPQTQEQYEARIREILDRRETFDADGNPEPQALTLDRAAEALFGGFEATIERELRPDGRLSSITDWGGKLAGATARIAGLLAVGDRETAVGEHHVRRAITIAEYLEDHALAAFDEMGAVKSTSEARFVWEYLERSGVSVVSRRDLYRALRGRFAKPDDLDPILDMLVASGALAQEDAARDGPGRKRSPRFRVISRTPPGTEWTD